MKQAWEFVFMCLIWVGNFALVRAYAPLAGLRVRGMRSEARRRCGAKP